MKVMFLITVAAVSLLPLIRAEESLPPDVQSVVDQRSAAIVKINKIYLQELEKLKVTYTKQGNLDVANMVASLIKQAQSPSFISDESRLKEIKGKWYGIQLTPQGARQSSRNFEKDYVKDEGGNRHPYSFVGDKIRIFWNGSQDNFEYLTFEPGKPDVMHGVNQNGTKATYTRQRK